MSYLSALVKNIKVEEIQQEETVQEPVQEPVKEQVLEEKKVDKKKSSYKTNDNKNAFRRKKNSKGSKKFSKKPKDPNYMKVLSKVQEEFLLKVLPDKKKCDMIESNIMYMKNWNVPVYIDTTEDIVETFEDKEYTFQKSRVLGSRYFQNMVREMYATKFGNINVSFQWNRNYPDSYTIRVRG